MSDQEFVLKLTPKKIFVAGVAAGAVCVLALGYLMGLKGGSSLFGGSLERKPAAPVDAPAPTDDGTQPVGAVTPVSDDDHIRGDKNAEVTLIEYSDFQCPFCSRFHPTMLQVMEEYKGKVRWIYRHFPLKSIHPDAQKAAEASECASEQGKFWEMADKMFEKQANGLGIENLKALAKEAGVKDAAKFASCLDSGKYTSVVDADLAGGEAAGVTGTPGTIIMGKDGKTQMVPGALPFDAVKQMIDASLAS
jgi:protein-disulfide isomerase